MKKIVAILLMITVILSVSVNSYAGELDKNEKKILKQLRDSSFPVKLEDRYINQLENYMCQDDVEIPDIYAEKFIKYLSEALVQKESFENNGKTFKKFSSAYIHFEKAGRMINLLLAYDSALNNFYAIYNKGYDGYVAIDTGDIIKNTDEPQTVKKIKSPDDDDEEENDYSVEIIFASVIFLCMVGFLLNLRKWNKKIRKKNKKIYDEEDDDELEVADRRMRKARLQTFSYRNFSQLLRYFYIPIVMGLIVVIGIYLASVAIWDLNDSVQRNFVNTQPIAFNHKPETKPYLGEESKQKKEISIKNISVPRFNEQYGVLSNLKLKVYSPIFFGDRPEQLESGAGTYIGSYIPGFGKTILIGAHDTTYFKGLENVSKGDEFKFTTTYGIYRYKVSDIKIYDDNFDDAYDLTANKEQLILYTCYPFGAVNGKKTQRMFVYLDFVSGPSIKR